MAEGGVVRWHPLGSAGTCFASCLQFKETDIHLCVSCLLLSLLLCLFPSTEPSFWMAAWSEPNYPFARLLALLQLAAFVFSLPPNAAWMLLLLNIICISCFSTCNAHFCLCLTHTTFGLGPIFKLHSCCFSLFLFRTKWTLRHRCGCSTSVMAGHKSLAGYDCLLRLCWGANKAVNPHCVCHMHLCIWLSCLIFCNKGMQLLLWAWINETFKEREREREELWHDTFRCLFLVIS